MCCRVISTEDEEARFLCPTLLSFVEGCSFNSLVLLVCQTFRCSKWHLWSVEVNAKGMWQSMRGVH